MASFAKANLPSSLRDAATRALGEDAFSPPTASSSSSSSSRRVFLTCCVRQARDKNPQRFVEMIENLSERHGGPEWWLRPVSAGGAGGIIPLMFGSTPDPEFSASLRQRLVRACPFAIAFTEFVSTEQLLSIFHVSVLNVHPCCYDAFGLTVVEAAVCGCPTLLHEMTTSDGDGDGGGPRAVGAADFLSQSLPARSYFSVDMNHEEAVITTLERCLECLVDASECTVGQTAQAVAISYDTTACGRALLSVWGSGAN